MNTVQLAALILAAEFALLAWGILFWMLRWQRHQDRADAAHAGAVMEHLEAREVSHREALTRLFETTYRLEGEELAAKVEEYLARERAFYNMMLNLYLNRDGARLKEIPAELSKVVKPWAEITPVGMISASEVSHLETEKAQLAVELEHTKETLEQLMQEYMAAFKKIEQQTDDSPPEPDRRAQTPDERSGEDMEVKALDIDADDFDVQLAVDTELKEPPRPGPPDDEIKPTASIEDALDPNDIDAMLEALAKEAVGELEPAPATPDKGSEPPLSPEEIEEARARDELEGLADLFDPPANGEGTARQP
jgi:hypothetical protein